jgi:hypothetical protein
LVYYFLGAKSEGEDDILRSDKVLYRNCEWLPSDGRKVLWERRSTVGFFREIGWGSMRNEGMEWCDAEVAVDDP